MMDSRDAEKAAFLHCFKVFVHVKVHEGLDGADIRESIFAQ